MSIWFRQFTLEEVRKFQRDTMGEHIGIEITGIGPDSLEATMPVDNRTMQPDRILHGGASVALAEDARQRRRLDVRGPRTLPDRRPGNQCKPPAACDRRSRYRASEADPPRPAAARSGTSRSPMSASGSSASRG
jgi:hypothetical protein